MHHITRLAPLTKLDLERILQYSELIEDHIHTDLAFNFTLVSGQG